MLSSVHELTCKNKFFSTKNVIRKNVTEDTVCRVWQFLSVNLAGYVCSRAVLISFQELNMYSKWALNSAYTVGK
jgi:hypothetical protein